jgi:hypothetical protein
MWPFKNKWKQRFAELVEEIVLCDSTYDLDELFELVSPPVMTDLIMEITESIYAGKLKMYYEQFDERGHTVATFNSLGNAPAGVVLSQTRVIISKGSK